MSENTPTTTPAARVDRTDVNLDAAHAEVKAEIARTDTKASLLLAFVGAGLAAVWTVVTGARLPVAAVAVCGVGTAVLVAAAAVLLSVVRPRLGGVRPGGFPRWATLTAAEIAAEMREDVRAEDIARLSRLALAKFLRIQRAVDLLRAAGVVFAIAAGVALGVAA